MPKPARILKNMDTFEVLTDGYCRDKNLAYAEYETSLRPLKGQRVKDFVVLGKGFARDSAHAYYWGTAMRSCSAPMTLELVPDTTIYARDRDHIYYESAALKGAEVDDWRPLDSGFSTDSRSVFYGAKKLPRVHMDSWEHVEGPYSRDSKSVFLMWWRVKDAAPATFTVPPR